LVGKLRLLGCVRAKRVRRGELGYHQADNLIGTWRGAHALACGYGFRDDALYLEERPPHRAGGAKSQRFWKLTGADFRVQAGFAEAHHCRDLSPFNETIGGRRI
jgi:hypothetical protein